MGVVIALWRAIHFLGPVVRKLAMFAGIYAVFRLLVRSLRCRSQQPTDLTRRSLFWPFPLLDTYVTVAGG